MNEWTKSSFCDSSACVEVMITDKAVYIRDTEKPDDIVITTRESWDFVMLGVRAGEFDLVAS